MSMLDIELEVKRVRGEILACRTAEELLQKHNELRAYYAVKYSSLIRARKASIPKQNKDMLNQFVEFFAGTDTAPPASPSTTPVQPAREVFIPAEAAQRKGAERTTLVRRRRVVT